MFSKTVVVLSTLILAVSAGKYQCNTGELQCCQSVKTTESPTVTGLFGVLNIAVGSVTGLVGVTCSPISALGVAGNSCSAQPVCCEGNNFNGVVALGCSPVNANL